MSESEDDQWAQADRISDAIIDAVNAERAKPGFDPVVSFAGVLLGLIGYGRTSPVFSRPNDMHEVMAAAEKCLRAIERYRDSR